MTFSVLPAEKGDLTELVRVFHAAFATDPEFSIIYRDCDMDEVVASDVADYEKEFETPGRRFFKVVDGEEDGYVAPC